MPTPPQPAIVTETRNFNELSAEDMAAIDSTKTPLSKEESDPELQKQIQEYKDGGSKGIDTASLDEEIDPAELARMAKMTKLITPQTPEQVASKKRKRIGGE